MNEPVQVRWSDIVLHLQDPKLQHSTWTAHCGCKHWADGRWEKCPGHAAGQEIVEGQRA
jgi:hypothetical protein